MAHASMFDKLKQVEARFEDLNQQLANPAVLADGARYQKTAKAHAEISELVEKYREWKQVEKGVADAKALLDDPDMKALAQEELAELEKRREALEQELKVLLLPSDPNDEKNVILEIRAGTGGDEASLFAADLFRMYSRYAESQRWKVEVLSTSPSLAGGLKEVVASIQGQKVFSKLKYESGVHRVQRVPQTETQGRIHTSAATVAVLPEADDIDVHIEPKDLRIDTFCSSGPGGQSVNTTYSAVRITTCPLSWWSVARTRSRRSKTRPRPCGCCARGSTSWSRPASTPPSPPSGAEWSRAATAAKRFAPTTSPRAA